MRRPLTARLRQRSLYTGLPQGAHCRTPRSGGTRDWCLGWHSCRAPPKTTGRAETRQRRERRVPRTVRAATAARRLGAVLRVSMQKSSTFLEQEARRSRCVRAETRPCDAANTIRHRAALRINRFTFSEPRDHRWHFHAATRRTSSLSLFQLRAHGVEELLWRGCVNEVFVGELESVYPGHTNIHARRAL